MTVNTAYRHGDYPVEVNGVFAIRVQDVNLDKNIPLTNYYEMGNFGVVGSQQDTAKYTGSLRWFPINSQMECLFAGYATSGSTVTMASYVNSGGGIPVKTLKGMIEGCKVTGIDYSCQANGEFSGTVNFSGNEWKAGGAIVATTPSGAACYKSKDVRVDVKSVTGVRVSGISWRVNIPGTDLVELNNANPVATVQDSPVVTCDIDFYESDLMAANTEIAVTDPGDIVIRINGGTDLAYRLHNMVSGPGVQGQRGTVNGWATRRYSYQTGSYHASYGMTVAGIP